MSKLTTELKKRHNWYLKLHAFNEKFLNRINNSEVESDLNLDFFYNNRASILNIISKYNQNIDRICNSISFDINNLTNRDRTIINFYIREKKLAVEEISKQDSTIIDLLEKELDKVGNEIANTRMHKDRIGKYKANIECNGRLDKCL